MMTFNTVEPQTKLVSGDQLPYVGLFPSWNFDPWNHHASHSIPKTDSTWDCCSSTQSFVCGSVFNFIRPQLRKTSLLLVSLCIATALPGLVNAGQYEIVIENHRFIPQQLEVTAGEKHRLIVINKDSTPEEFESYELNREKIVAGHSKITIFLPPLDTGIYPFFGEFNEATAQGRLLVK